MQVKNLLALAFAATASAENITAALASENSTLSTLISLLGAQPAIVTALAGATNITVLAPSNDAFNTFLNTSAGKIAAADSGTVAALLSYHVLKGSYPASAFTNTSQFLPTLLSNTTFANVTGGQVVEAKLNGSSVDIFSGLKAESIVTKANINFTGGVIHIIDTVLTIPEKDSSTAVAANLTSLAGALTEANLVSTVDSLSDITIFAPTNAAFQAIGSATGSLNASTLASILEYHVVKGTIGYSSLLSNTTLTTVNGANVTITIEDGAVFVNSARVILADVLVSNGVVHVIDNVLNPGNATATPASPTATTPGAPAFAGASSASNVPFTSGVVAPSSASVSPTPAGTSKASGNAGARETGFVGAAAVFGAGAVWLNI